MSDDHATIRYVETYDVARLTLTRPPLNIMTIEMMREMSAALGHAAASPVLKALVIASEGRAFSAGVAIEDHTADRVEAMLDAFHEIFRRLRALDCVTLAAVQGAALGGGAELATFCDVVIASEDARLGQPEIKVGVFPPVAALHYPVRVGAARTLALLLSGEAVPAAEAQRIGLVDRVVPRPLLEETVEAQVECYRALSAAGLRFTKRAVRDSLGAPFERALGDLEDLYRFELMKTEDATEGLRAFLEKRPPVWRDR